LTAAAVVELAVEDEDRFLVNVFDDDVLDEALLLF
jgi:hypothetical protein